MDDATLYERMLDSTEVAYVVGLERAVSRAVSRPVCVRRCPTGRCSTAWSIATPQALEAALPELARAYGTRACWRGPSGRPRKTRAPAPPWRRPGTSSTPRRRSWRPPWTRSTPARGPRPGLERADGVGDMCDGPGGRLRGGGRAGLGGPAGLRAVAQRLPGARTARPRPARPPSTWRATAASTVGTLRRRAGRGWPGAHAPGAPRRTRARLHDDVAAGDGHGEPRLPPPRIPRARRHRDVGAPARRRVLLESTVHAHRRDHREPRRARLLLRVLPAQDARGRGNLRETLATLRRARRRRSCRSPTAPAARPATRTVEIIKWIKQRARDRGDGAPDAASAPRRRAARRSSTRSRDAGIENVLALRGDPPRGPDRVASRTPAVCATRPSWRR